MDSILKKFYKVIFLLCFWEQAFFSSLNWSAEYTFFHQISIVLVYIVMICLILYSFMAILEYKNWQPVLALGVFIVTYISGTITGNSNLTLIFPLIILAFNQDLNSLLIFYLKNIVACLILILVTFQLGLTKNVIINFYYGTGSSLGMGHPNNLSAYLVNLIIIFLYLYFKDKNIIFTVLIGIISIAIIWKITFSRTAIIELIIYIILFGLYKTFRAVNFAPLFKVMEVIGIIIIILSFYLMINYSKLSNELDSSFIVRFSQGNLIYSMYGIKWLGSNIPFVSTIEALQYHTSALVLDNAYLRMLIYHGIACFIVFMIIIMFMLKNINDHKSYILLICALVFLIGGFMEKSVYYLQYNFTLLAAFTYINPKLKNDIYIN